MKKEKPDFPFCLSWCIYTDPESIAVWFYEEMFK